jgi:chorismate--pyruvate lyase
VPDQTEQMRPSSGVRWRPARTYTAASLPPKVRRWLLDEGSLTARLAGMGRGRFGVRRLSQAWELPLLSERIMLGIPGGQRALVRKVGLLLDSCMVVFARSVLPVRSLRGELGHLRHLENKSLGSILFAHANMHRSPFEVALVPPGNDYLPAGLQQELPAWGRRSRFVIGRSDLMVSEVFLQSFSPWPDAVGLQRARRGKVDAAIARATQ